MVKAKVKVRSDESQSSKFSVFFVIGKIIKFEKEMSTHRNRWKKKARKESEDVNVLRTDPQSVNVQKSCWDRQKSYIGKYNEIRSKRSKRRDPFIKDSHLKAI